MIAILIASGQNSAFYGLDESLPIPLVPLVDRPFIQHVIEYLVKQDIRQFELILSHLPEKIESTLGDGARWGCTFNYHLAGTEEDAFRLAGSIATNSQKPFVLGSGASLPGIDPASLEPDTVLIRSGRWTGWGYFAPGATALSNLELDFPVDTIPRDVRVRHVDSWLGLSDGEEFLTTQNAVLTGLFPGLEIAGREAEPGVWISRNVVLHPSVVIEPPVHIGENCRIGRGARIGPSAVIGANCIVDIRSIVTASAVLPGTYVGEGLELDSVIVNRNRLINIRLGTSFLASDTFLLGNLSFKSSDRAIQRFRDAFTAVVLLLVLWPLLLLGWLFFVLTGRGRLTDREVVSIPCEDDPTTWRTVKVLQISRDGTRARTSFFRTFLPGLLSVAMGRVFLVGVAPRTSGEISALPSDWKSLYLKTKAGLITEADILFGADATEDELYTAEIFYSATESAGGDLRLAAAWLWKLLTGSGTREAQPARDSSG